MYVKLYQRILESSIAQNRKLRHFFTDLLLCADRDGNVVATEEAIARKINADIEEVRWGLAELQNPDSGSFTANDDGRRIVPLEGCGHGWKIVNYVTYRDYKTSSELRAATNERVRRYREKKNSTKIHPVGGGVTMAERLFCKQEREAAVAATEAVERSAVALAAPAAPVPAPAKVIEVEGKADPTLYEGWK